MAAFINNDITTAGLIVLAKGVAGQKINYTKIVLGDGYLEEGQTPRTLTGVVSPKATVDIAKLKINGDGTVAVGGIFTNGDETDGFYYRELGLYAEDPDPEVGEVLYASWTGHISHGNTYHLRQNMDAYFFSYFPELKPSPKGDTTHGPKTEQPCKQVEGQVRQPVRQPDRLDRGR